ncbi:hypothetical protein BI49514_02025 [Brevibacterium iodinum ATCC 49514]|uniref:Uncharacterized protein n=1 Tax=Brevibacterium iodinum ATCC 49514 TaxID=1255616 RepID=A0A2H1JI80_9MICO|nr:hypothetical protein [Brevibacterium iodinum]SMX87226.1 hypothetical protein BI49514_02025 [Brevibacterium iodinum ATCC 49514]SUW14405.1 Uncharacterised protein [Brevibacterium iodinum]
MTTASNTDSHNPRIGLDARRMAITIVAALVFLVTWIDAGLLEVKAQDSYVSSPGPSLLRLALIAVAGAAAITIARGLRPIPRSVLIVVTVFLCAVEALKSIFTIDTFGADTGDLADNPALTTALGAVSLIVTVGFPIVVALALAAVTAQLVPIAEAAAPAVLRRRSRIAAIGLFAATGIVFLVWLLRTMFVDAMFLFEYGDAVNALGAAVGLVSAIAALRVIAEARSLPADEPAVGPTLSGTTPRSARTLAFVVIACGLHLCWESTILTVGYPPAVAMGYPGWVVSMFGLVLGSLVLAVRTLNCAPTGDIAPTTEAG